MKTRLSFAILTGAALFFASCSDKENPVDSILPATDDIKSTEIAITLPGDTIAFSEVLTEDEVAGLFEMREEEKLAHDVYIYFYETYEYLVFNNISKSEDAHSSAVLYLLNGFGLADPAVEGVGEFNADLFKTLYADLTAQGSTSLADALKVGAFIEEYDIADLQLHLEETTNTAILRVYNNLLRGSQTHLKAYTAALNRLGETYTPTVLSQDEYDSIVNSTNDESDDDLLNEGTFVPGTGICDGTGPGF